MKKYRLFHQYFMETALLLSLNRDLKIDGCQSNLNVMLKQLQFFYQSLDFFCRRHFSINRRCPNDLFQFMQNNNF